MPPKPQPMIRMRGRASPPAPGAGEAEGAFIAALSFDGPARVNMRCRILGRPCAFCSSKTIA
jgi:hypothetical protein